jgi:tetratricopeptide (TPR) repeat protein
MLCQLMCVGRHPDEVAGHLNLASVYQWGPFYGLDGEHLLSQAEDHFQTARGLKHHPGIHDNPIEIELAEVANDFVVVTMYRPTTKEKAASAMEWAERAIRLSPDDKRFLPSLGFCYYRLGEYERALGTLDDLQDVDAGNDVFAAMSRLFLAMSLWKCGHEERALDTYRKLTFEPTDIAEREIFGLLREETAQLLELNETTTKQSQ